MPKRVKYQNFEVTGEEPYYPGEFFSVVVAARNAAHARRYIRWLHDLERSIKLSAVPTDAEATEEADRF